MSREARRARLEAVRLIFVTDRNRARYPIVEVAGRACRGGADLVIVRERDLPDGAFLDLARTVQAAAHAAGRLALVTNRLPEALAAETDGVHLGLGGPSAAAARTSLGEDALVGRSVHGVGEIPAAAERDLDYLIAAPIFATASKPGRQPIGLEVLSQICARTSLPVFALGGMREDRVEACLAAGARGVAVIGAISEAADPAAAAAALRARLGAVTRA